MTLAERITAILDGAGYRPLADAPAELTHDSGPFFDVSDGIGATVIVSVARAGATDRERDALLHEIAIRLHEAGLNAERPAGCLRVSEARCKCVITGGDLLPMACPAHGTSCEHCGGLGSCSDDCGEIAR